MSGIWNHSNIPTREQYVWSDPALKAKVDDWIANPDSLQHMVFAGHPGIGKTTLARMICEELGLEKNLDYVLFRVGMRNAAELIEEIKNFCESGFSPLKIIILDEADKLTVGAQETMRGITDQYESMGCRFILTCNDAGKLKNYMGSRIILVEFTQLDEERFFERMLEIALVEGVDIEDDATYANLERIKTQTYPDLRQAINLMQYGAKDGKIVNVGKTVSERPWHLRLMESVGDLNISNLREDLQGLRRDEIATAYRFITNNSDIFGDNEGEAIVLIAKYLSWHSHAEYPDVILCGLIADLNKLWKAK